MKTRDELLSELNCVTQKLQKFRCPEFDNIYSRQYYDDMFLNMFANNQNFSYIFGDLNKLGIINQLYGHEEGNKVIANFIEILKSKLPKDALISRLGGDEFSIILPNIDSETANNYIMDINKTLNNNSHFNHGLSVEFSAKHSSNGNISELAYLTEKEVSNRKNARKEHDSPAEIFFDDFVPLNIPDNISEEESKKWEKLNSLINVSVYNFIQNIRPSNTLNFEPQQIVDSADFITSAYNYLLNSSNNITDTSTNYNHLSKEHLFPDEEYNFHNVDLFNHLNPKTASAIHSLISESKNVNLTNSSNNAIKNAVGLMNSLVEDLVRDESSGLLSKSYFRLYLADELSKIDKDYQAVFFSTSGIKLSNTAHDHSFTDVRLSKTSDLFFDAFSKFRDFNNNSFECSGDDIYLINQGAGNFLALLPMDQSLSTENIDNIIEHVNTSSDIKDPYSSFMMAAGYQNNIDKTSGKSFIDSVRNLKDSTNLEKDELKKNLFKSTDALIAFKKTFNTCIDYYLNNVKDSKSDISNKTLVLENMFRSFSNFESLHNKNRNLNISDNNKIEKLMDDDSEDLEK